MPEGHTIHRLARDHTDWFAGQRLLVLSPQGRFEEEAEVLSGKRLKEVSAHGKHLFYHWPRGLVTHIHLGLYGMFRIATNPPPEPRGAVRLRMIGHRKTLDLNGPNRCELVDRDRYRSIRSRLGEDPLRDDASVERVLERLNRTARPIGTVLLDQSVIAGIGNIYRAEILFLMGIHPLMPSNELGDKRIQQLWELSSRLLRTGVKHNQIITRRPPERNGSKGEQNKRERLNVYKRSRCPQCNAAIQCYDLAARKMFSCRTCQKL